MNSSHHVIDSHVVLWHLQDDVRMGSDAFALMEDPSASLHLPVICLAEMAIAIERKRVAVPSFEALLDDLYADPRIVMEPVDETVALQSCRLTKISDIHDRFIVAIAMKLASTGLSTKLVTADREIAAADYVDVLWAHARKYRP